VVDAIGFDLEVCDCPSFIHKHFGVESDLLSADQYCARETIY
jgi:hypothetical protein